MQMIEALEHAGVSVDVAASDDDGPGRRLCSAAPERFSSGRHYFRKVADFYTFTPSFGPWLRRHLAAYDVVHIHGLFSYVDIVAGQIARSVGKPYFVTPHGMANRFGMRHKRLMKQMSFGLFERALLQGAEWVQMTSYGEERDFADLSLRARTKVIPLAVAPLPPGDANRFLDKYPVLQGQRVIAFMGRIDSIKNIEGLIDALSLVSSSMHDAQLVVCGSGSYAYQAALQSRAIRLGVADRIIWTGFLGGQNKSDMLAAAHVFALPSFSESFGMAVLEALSAGLPCVVGRDVAIAEDLSAVGLAVAVNPTAEGIAAGIVNALALRDATFAVRAREFVVVNYASETMGAAIFGLYQNSLSSQVLPRPA